MFTLLDELSFVIEPQISPFCGPLFFARPPESAVCNATANGSYGLVDTGAKKLLVTCYHVWEEFQKSQKEDSKLKMFIGPDRHFLIRLDSSHLIDEDKSLDIATFHMESLSAVCRTSKFYPLNQNPARRLKKGDRLFFLGFMGFLRSAKEEGMVSGKMSILVHVTGVSRDGLYFLSDISKLTTFYAEQKPDSVAHAGEHGGISGVPCFLIRQGRAAQLVGFATAESPTYLRFTHASCLNPDGTIKRTAT